ncbi:hypothetical protein [Leptospira santarosai]|uniref:hypothetical protein n=1 Tax=Leptospira santarosai TaxID=28183 RepID=UPI0024AFFA6B|nr:hypothetical protein [Leptospira santarosai]MDI7225129.1 hypothetical protein [Leptospira santarosai]MDI7229677.1 hypothetical protein [Leptospira santarosai]
MPKISLKQLSYFRERKRLSKIGTILFGIVCRNNETGEFLNCLKIESMICEIRYGGKNSFQVVNE